MNGEIASIVFPIPLTIAIIPPTKKSSSCKSHAKVLTIPRFYAKVQSDHRIPHLDEVKKLGISVKCEGG